MISLRALALVAALALSVSGCGDANFALSGAQPDTSIEDALNPYSIENCAVSEIKKKPGFGFENRGGIGGHAVMYLTGACLDQDAHYPTLRLCKTSERGPDGGVGVSANGHFNNAEWVGVQGRSFFFDGIQSPNERLTHAAYQATQAEAKRRGIYDGVEFHEDAFEGIPEGMSRADFKFEESIGTDYAVAYGRGRYCARQPITEPQMTRVIDYLNAVNTQHRSGEHPSQMSVVENSCVHLAHNVLATAGAWNKLPTDQFVLFALFSFPVPLNEFVHQMRRANDLPLDDPGQIYDDPAARAALLRDDWLPTTPGAIATSVPPHLNNDIYDTDLKLIFYQTPVLSPLPRRFDDIFAAPRTTRLGANLHYFSDWYERIKTGRKPLEWWLSRRGGSAEDQAAFAEFYQRYYVYIDRMYQRTGQQIRAEERIVPPANLLAASPPLELVFAGGIPGAGAARP